MSTMERGVLYVASGPDYVLEASESAGRVKEELQIPIALITDADTDHEVFEAVITIEDIERHYGAACLYLDHSPFQKTLYLDTDTHVCSDVSELFDLLGRFDVALAHAPYRRAPGGEVDAVRDGDISNAFPEYNRGVIAFADNDRVSDFLSLYKRRFMLHRAEHGITHDQPALRQALYESAVRIATLPPEYNYRLPFPGFAQQEVKIFHGRHDDMATIAAAMNASREPRVHFWANGDIEVVTSEGKHAVVVDESGLATTLTRLFRHLRP